MDSHSIKVLHIDIPYGALEQDIFDAQYLIDGLLEEIKEYNENRRCSNAT